MEENLNYVRDNAGSIRKIVEQADATTMIGSQLPLGAELERAPELVEILLGEIAPEKHPVDGHVMNLRKDVSLPEKMAEYGTFKATLDRAVPSAYFIPSALADAIDRLHAHGIVATPLETATTMAVEEFRIDGSAAAARPFQNHNERTLKGAWVSADRQLPAGTCASTWPSRSRGWRSTCSNRDRTTA